jgi:hypothetical protein
MSDPNASPITAIAEVIASLFTPSRNPPPPKPPRPPMAPHELHTLWTCLSAGALAGCAYVPFFAAALLRQSPADVVGEFVVEFVHTPLDPPAVLVIWCAVVVIAAAYLLVGLRNAAEGAHAGLWAFWSAAVPVTVLLVMALHAPGLYQNPLVLGCLLPALAMAAMRFYLARRGGSAMRTVQRNIRRKNRPMRPARTRRWWRLFF